MQLEKQSAAAGLELAASEQPAVTAESDALQPANGGGKQMAGKGASRAGAKPPAQPAQGKAAAPAAEASASEAVRRSGRNLAKK